MDDREEKLNELSEKIEEKLGEKTSSEAQGAEKNSSEVQDAEETKASGKQSAMKEFFSWVATFLAAILVALFLKNFVIINATVPTGSMENTIMPGDDMIGLRLAYLNSDPERGDIVIFDFPDDESQKYVKRIIGLPGDTVYITEGKVYINGSEEPLDEPYIKEQWVVATGPFYFEVPEDSYFVMGDNRNSSYDSRYWTNTYVSRDKITGKAWLIYFPFQHFGTID